LGGARLAGANFAQADLSEAYLGAVKAQGTILSRALLRGAKLEEADLTGAKFDEAVLAGATLRNVILRRASLEEADLSQARIVAVDLSGADLRRSIGKGAHIERCVLTGAKVHRAQLVEAKLIGTIADYLDASREGDGEERLSLADFLASLGRRDSAPPPPVRRYIGVGDILKNAELEFGDGAEVQVDGHLEGCSIILAANASLIIGEQGVLERCQIKGGNIEIHGRFLEMNRIGFVRPGQLLVSMRGAVSATIEQPPAKTRFGFASGCRLRLSIKDPSQAA
jgi:hypothetical protein